MPLEAVPRTLATMLLLVGAAACRGSMPVTESASSEIDALPACEGKPVFPGRDTVSIVATDSIRPALAIGPRNAVERFIFERAYETLVSIDCHDRVLPVLAQSWNEAGSGTLTIVLRDDARFWSGSRVTAHDIVASWRQTATAHNDSALLLLVDSVRVPDTQTLLLPRLPGGVRTLANAAYGVYRDAGPSRWPEGTGQFRVVHTSPLLLTPDGGGPGAVLRFNVANATIARDLMDAGADIVFSDAAAVTSYARARTDFVVRPLDWDRTWYLSIPARTRAAAPLSASDSVAAHDLRVSLANDVVRGDARAAAARSSPEFAPCATSEVRAPAPAESGRVIYPADDPIARALAERIVALAAIAARGGDARGLAALAPELVRVGRLSAQGMDPAALQSTLQAGGAIAAVVTQAAPGMVGCLAPGMLPLIQTRSHMIIRSGLSARQQR